MDSPVELFLTSWTATAINGMTCLTSSYKQPYLVHILIDRIELAGRLFDLARTGEKATLQTYITAGTPINLTNNKGDTFIMLAAYHGHTDTVRMLCELGGDVNRVNDRGQTPLAGAVFKNEDKSRLNYWSNTALIRIWASLQRWRLRKFFADTI